MRVFFVVCVVGRYEIVKVCRKIQVVHFVEVTIETFCKIKKLALIWCLVNAYRHDVNNCVLSGNFIVCFCHSFALLYFVSLRVSFAVCRFLI